MRGEGILMSETTFATRWNLDAVEAAYERWRKDPQSVDEAWRLFFEGFELGLQRPAPPSIVDRRSAAGAAAESRPTIGVVRLIDAYRDLGHFLARTDPLTDPPASYPLLELSEFGLSEADLDRVFDT